MRNDCWRVLSDANRSWRCRWCNVDDRRWIRSDLHGRRWWGSDWRDVWLVDYYWWRRGWRQDLSRIWSNSQWSCSSRCFGRGRVRRIDDRRRWRDGGGRCWRRSPGSGRHFWWTILFMWHFRWAILFMRHFRWAILFMRCLVRVNFLTVDWRRKWISFWCWWSLHERSENFVFWAVTGRALLSQGKLLKKI